MQRSAPWLAARASLASDDDVIATFAPIALASCNAAIETPPVPWASTQSPGPVGRKAVSADHAVNPAQASVEVTGDVITVHGPAGDRSATPDDLCFVLRFDAVVRDVPAAGEPKGLVHAIERKTLDALPGGKTAYAGRQQLDAELTRLLAGMKNVAME